MPLVTSTDLLERLGSQTVDTLPNVGALLLEVHQHLALVGVEADVVRGEADVAGGLADNGLVVDLGLRGDLAEDHDHVGLGRGLASDLRRFSFFWEKREGEEEVEVGGKDSTVALLFLLLLSSLACEIISLSLLFILTFASGSCSRHASRMASETCDWG